MKISPKVSTQRNNGFEERRVTKSGDLLPFWHFLEGLGNIFGISVMPSFCRGVLGGVWFSPKLSYHRIKSLAVYLPIFLLCFYFGIRLSSYTKNTSSQQLYQHRDSRVSMYVTEGMGRTYSA